VIWLGPGWPFLARSDAKSSEQLFDSVIYFSDMLRSARMILYSIDPEGVTAKDNSAITEGFLLNSRPSSIRANGHAPDVPIELSNTYYAEFLKGVKEAKQSNPNDLALQVLAYQSGGLVLQDNNDIEAMIRRCAGDATSLYTLSYVPAHGSGSDVYHELQISLKKSSQPLRTRTGLYAK
jgi:VWFA-related protein